MKIEIVRAQIVNTGGPDNIFLHTLLPEATFPFEGNAVVKLTCAAGTGEEYLRRNFGGLPFEILSKYTDGKKIQQKAVSG